MVDPWAAQNKAQGNFNEALFKMPQVMQQQEQEDQRASLYNQQLATGQIALDDATQKHNDALSLRQQLAGVTEPQPVPNSPLTPTAPEGIGVEMPPAAPQKSVAQQKLDILQAHAEKTGDFDPVTKAINLDGIMAKKRAEIEAGGGDPAQYYKAQMQLNNVKELMTQLPAMLKTPQGRQLAAGYLQAAKAADPTNDVLKNMDLDQLGKNANNQAVLAVSDPHTGEILGHKVYDDATGELKFYQAHAKPQPQQGSFTYAGTDPNGQPVILNNHIGTMTAGGQPFTGAVQAKPKTVNINGLSPEQNAALSRAYDNGLDPSKVNSRNAKIYADQEILKPGRDWNNMAAVAGAEREAATADPKSIIALTKQADSLGSFDANFKGAIQILEPLAAKIQNGQYPGINHISQVLSYQGGNPDLKIFKNQLMTSMIDYQKMVTAGSNITSAELSIGAQKRAEELLSSYDNPETFKNSISVMLQDAAVKTKSVQDALDRAKGRMRGGGNTSPGQDASTDTPQIAPGGKLTYQGYTVEVHP